MPWAIVAPIIAAVGSTASSVYATKRAGKINQQSLDASERSDVRAVDREREAEDKALTYKREDDARREKLYREAADRDQQRWQDYLRVNEPHWGTGSQALGSLRDIAGFTGGAPQVGPAPGSAPPPRGGMPAPPPPMGSGPPVLRAMPKPRIARQGAPVVQIPTAPTMSLADLMAMTEFAKGGAVPANQRYETPYA